MPKSNKTHGQLDHHYLIGDADQVVFSQYFFLDMLGFPPDLENKLIKYCKDALPNFPNAWAYPLESKASIFQPLINGVDHLILNQNIWHESNNAKKPHTEIAVEARIAGLEYGGTFVKRTVQWGCKYFGSFSNPVVKRLRGKTEQVYIETNF